MFSYKQQRQRNREKISESNIRKSIDKIQPIQTYIVLRYEERVKKQ